MAANFINRYQKTIKGNLIQIGNTLGLSKASNSLTPGTLGSIGVFTSTNLSNQVTGWPAGTTTSFAQNSSASILTLPAGAIVDYAELMWSASYVVPGGDVTASIGNAITLRDPLGNVNSVTATGVNQTGLVLSESGENSTNYVKSANVTSIVAAAGSGTYICGAVPCTMSATSNFLQYAGWSLYVVYRLSSDPVRNIIIFIGSTTSVDPPYSVPINYPGPPYPIRMYYTVGEGDAIITGDAYVINGALQIGTSVQPAGTNPFSSIVGNQTGGIDTTGTFGTFNPSGTSATNINGGRQGWDIANNINVSSAFTGAVANVGIDVTSNSDPAIVNANGFVVDLSQPIATLTKSVDKTTARAGDTINYSLVYKFTTVPMSTANIILVDTIPTGTTFQSGSVFINNTPYTTTTPNPPGINLGTILAPTTFTVTFKVTATTTVNPLTIPNSSYGSYNFVSGGTPFTNENTSNSVTTIIDPFNASIVKGVSDSYQDIGATLTYVITIPNNGATLSNVILKDTIPSGTSLVSNSLVINGVPSSLSPNPPGVTIPNIPPFSVSTISFQVKVNTIPSPNPIPNSANLFANYISTIPNTFSLNSNIVTTQISNGDISSTKYVSKGYAQIGDLLQYQIVLKNTGNVSTENIIFTDNISSYTTFITNSFYENNTNKPGANPANSINLSAIQAGKVTTVTFNVIVNTIPSPNPINNSSNSLYTYFFSPSQTGKSSSSISNVVVTTVNMAILSGSTKYLDKSFANCGDTINYTIVIPNSGNVAAQNVIFKDTIPNGTALISNTVYINGNLQGGANPSQGITIPNINAGQVATVAFSVKVTC